jgi:hypothetical protein
MAENAFIKIGTALLKRQVSADQFIAAALT